MMKRIAILLLVCLAALSTRAQTQVDRISATTITNRGIIVFQSGTTPSVALGNVFQTNNNGSITNFLNGTKSQQIWVICVDTNTAFESGGGIITIGGTLNCTVNTIYSFIFNGTNWLQSATGGGGGGGGGSTTPGLPTNSVQLGIGGNFVGDSHLLFVPGTGLSLTGGAGFSHTLATGAANLNKLFLQPNAVTLSAGESASSLNFLSTGNTQFTVGTNVFKLPTTPGAAGTTLLTDGASPQQLSWSNNFTQGLQATLGTLTTDVNPFNATWTYNNPAQVFNGMKWTVVNTQYAPGSFDFQLCAGALGTNCFTIDPVGATQAPSQIGAGDGSAAGNMEFGQGPLPLVRGVGDGNTPTVGWAAPPSVTTPFLITMMSAPCSGVLNIYGVSTNYGTMRCSGDGANSIGATAQTGSISAFTLCSAANCPSGTYRVDVHANSTQACADSSGSSLSFALTYTDNAGTKTGQPVPLVVNGSSSLSATMGLGDTSHTGYGYAVIFSTGVNPIQLATTRGTCASGTAQYSYGAEVTRIR